VSLVLLLVSDLLVDLEVFRQFNILILLDFSINLDNTSQGLSINILIVIKDHVESLVNAADSLGD